MFEIGSALREARLRRRLELPSIERDTHIRGKYLAALEDEQFDVLPGAAYAKGFLRTYADYLGLDGQQFVDEYNSRFAPEEDLAALPLVQIDRPVRLLRARLLVLPLAAIVALTGWQLAHGGGHHAARAPSATHKRTIPPSTVTIKRAASSAPTTARLVLTAARGRCWLMVRRGSPNGALLFESTIAQGKTVRFTAGRLWIRMGAPWNLSATLAGKLLQLPAVTESVIVTPHGTSPG